MSIFDSPKPMLEPALWNPDNTIKPEMREYLMNLLQQLFPINKVYALAVLGSIVSHQYSDTSDIDINVMAREGEDFDYWHPLFKKFNDRINYLPGTKHPINFFFQEYSSEVDWSNSLGAYNLLTNQWEKKPIPFQALKKPEIQYEREIAYGKMLVEMIRNQDERAKEAFKRGDKGIAHAIYKELAIFFKQIEDNRKTAYRYGTGTPALQEHNILYKLIEDSEYKDLFTQLVAYYDEYMNPIKPKGQRDE